VNIAPTNRGKASSKRKGLLRELTGGTSETLSTERRIPDIAPQSGETHTVSLGGERNCQVALRRDREYFQEKTGREIADHPWYKRKERKAPLGGRKKISEVTIRLTNDSPGKRGRKDAARALAGVDRRSTDVGPTKVWRKRRCRKKGKDLTCTWGPGKGVSRQCQVPVQALRKDELRGPFRCETEKALRRPRSRSGLGSAVKRILSWEGGKREKKRVHRFTPW